MRLFRISLRLSLFLAGLLIACTGSVPALAQDSDSTSVAADSSKIDEKADLPLKPERWLQYTATSGSWISVDVGPGGRHIVFDLLGDLYIMPSSGGQADTLTSGMAFDSQPRFSPDGKSVLFISDRSGGENVWTLDLETRETKQLTEGKTNRFQSPDWSPDGKYYVVSKNAGRLGAGQLQLAHIDGGSGVKLIKLPATQRTTGPVFAPDGKTLWLEQRTGAWQYNAAFPQYRIASYNRETGKQTTRVTRYGSAFRPTPSPDGRWLVYGTRYDSKTGLIIRNLQTGDEQWLAYPVQRDDQESIASRDVLPGMSFTPDSRAVVAFYGGKIWRIPIDGSDATEIPFTAEVHVGIGPKLAFDYPIEDSSTFTIRQVRSAVPSPDDKRLAFSALDRLYVMDYPDDEPKRLTEEDLTENEPTWSPDGKWIAYVTWDGSEGRIMKVRSDGRGDPVRLTRQDGIYQSPVFSPDGTRIVATRGASRAFRDVTGPGGFGTADDYIWISADGGDIHVIAPLEGRGSHHFTQDPDRIFMYSRSRGLVSIRWDGTDEKAYVKVTGKTRPGAKKPNRPDAVIMAPTGDQALVEMNNEIYVVTVPVVGGDAPTISVADPSSASFPARRLTKVGGQFPAWSADGKFVHFSLGNAHFRYDLAEGKRIDEVIKKEKKEKEEKEKAEKKKDDAEKADGEEDGEKEKGEEVTASESTDADKDEEDEGTKPYEAAEHRILIQADRDIPSGTVVLRGARIVTMEGDDVIEDGAVVVTNNRITSVGASSSLVSPTGAKDIDVSGMTIVPGFVDTHSHMWPAWGIHKPSSWIYQANLAYGVTTTRDPQTATTDVLTYGDEVTAGMMAGPRIYSTGPGVFGDYIADPISSLDVARDVLKRYSEYYDTKTIKMYMAGNRQQRQWIIIAAKEQQLMPTTEGGLDLKYNLTMMLDGYPGQEHALPIYPLYDDVVKLTATSGIMYTPTLIVSYGGPFGENYFYTRENPHDDAKLRRFTPHTEIDQKTRRRGSGNGPGPMGWFREEEHVFMKHAETAKKIIEAGGRIGVGSHGQLQGLGYHWELLMLASGGMKPLDVLRAATIFGAEAIGLGKDLGSIRAGKLADMLVMRDNPLDDIRNTNSIRYVMKNGRLYDGDTLDEVWPDKKAAVYHTDDDPPSGLKAGIH